MRKSAEVGFIHIVAIVILLAGIVGGLYLVSHPQIFKPKASNNETRIEIVDSSGNPITSTTSHNVKVKLTYVPPTSNPTESISADPNPCTLGVGGISGSGSHCLTTISWSAPANTIPGLGVWGRSGTSGESCSGNELGIINPDSGTPYSGSKSNPHITAEGVTFDLCYNNTLLKSIMVTGVVVSNSATVQGVSTSRITSDDFSAAFPNFPSENAAAQPQGPGLNPIVTDQEMESYILNPDQPALRQKIIASPNALAAWNTFWSRPDAYPAVTLPWSDAEISEWIARNPNAAHPGGIVPGITRAHPQDLSTRVGIQKAYNEYIISTGGLAPATLNDLYTWASAGYATSTGPGTLPTSSPTQVVAFPTHFRVANSQEELTSAREQVFDQNGKIIDWVLTSGPGGKTVFSQFKVNGVWEQPVSASIGLVFPESQSSSTPTSTTSSAKLFVKADKAEAGVGEEIKVDLYVSTSAAANLFNAKLNFPKDLLEVTSIEIPTTSEITNFVEKTYDNTAGTISIVAGVPNPGISSTGEGILISTIIMKTKASGSAQITFDSSSQILKNSDNSNILTQRDGVTISIDQNFITRIISNIGSNTSQVGSTGSDQSSTSTGAAASGDGNGDGKIDLIDLSIIMSDFNKTSEVRVEIDMNKDGVINNFDSSLLRNTLIQNRVLKGN